nr:MAG TPA: hypothetical protein [Caudoviricetes sp.]
MALLRLLDFESCPRAVRFCPILSAGCPRGTTNPWYKCVLSADNFVRECPRGDFAYFLLHLSLVNYFHVVNFIISLNYTYRTISCKFFK